MGIRTAGALESEFYEGTVEEIVEYVSQTDPASAAKIQSVEARLASLAQAASDPDKAVEFYQFQSIRAKADELLARELEKRSPDEHQQLIGEWHQTYSIGTAILYHGYNFTGRAVPFTLTWPNFNWWPYDCNDAASSVKGWGVNVLFEHAGYRGRRFYTVGVYAEYPDLRLAGFDNLTSSIIAA
ncbi:hypothetical protein [Streptosporangium sp. NPDC020145]|uniref:hypothetical protein n=1 Tax=Streptosporangium sp. NPDC020145 TaxID=3154694 RepID=UPI00343A6A4D